MIKTGFLWKPVFFGGPKLSDSRVTAILGWPVVVLVGLLWALPLLVVKHTRPISTFYSEFIAFVILCAIFALAWMLKMVASRRDGAAPVMAVPAGFAVTLFTQLALMTLHQQMETFLAIGYAVGAAMAVQAGFWLSDERTAERVLRASACAMVLAGLLSAFAAWAQALSLEPHFGGLVAVYEDENRRRLFANLFQANHLASVLCIGMMGATFLLARREVRIWPYAISLLIMASAIYLTVSRMPWLLILVVCTTGYALLGDESRANPDERRINRVLLAAMPLAALTLGTILTSHVAGVLALRLDGSVMSRMVGESLQSSPRLMLWRYAWEMFREHSFLGVGWGEFTFKQYLLAERLGPVSTANNAHNLVLDLLAKTGVLGAALVLLPLAAWVVRVARAALCYQRRHQRVFCLGLVGIVLVHAMLEFPQTYAYFLLPVCLLLGIAETSGVRLFGRPMSITLGATALSLLCAGLVLIFADYRRAEVFFQENGFRRYGQDPAVVFGDWGRYGMTGLFAPDRDLIDEKLKLYEQALHLGPRPEYVRRYIVLLALRGEHDQAMAHVVRLNTLFAAAGDQQYKLLLKMCDMQPTELGAFKAKLIKRFGPSPA